MQSLRYVIAAIALGGIAVWVSENWFWFMPPPGMNAFEFSIAWLAYSLAAACALSAVIWTGVRGWPAAFLGGAMLGYLAEGVMVGTMYDAFPVQLVWTPLAWHGLLTGGVVLALPRAGFAPARLVLIWALFGLFGAYWGQYWTFERVGLPDPMVLALYVGGLSGVVVLGHLLLDWLGEMPRPPVWVLCIAPFLMFMLWWYKVIAGFVPQMLAFPVLMALLFWAMWRLGKRAAGPDLGVPGGWRHALFLIAPVVAVVLAPLGWAQGWGTLASNWVTAIGWGIASMAALGWMIWRAARV